jgi:radical SAM superfamily enzyme YgiQ (UPF0313 family)
VSRINLLMVSPLSYDPDSEDQQLKQNALYPFSIIYPLNYLLRNDLCDGDYIDLVMNDEATLLDRVEEEHFDLIGFTSTIQGRFHTIDLIRKVKQRSPSSKIVVGGVFFTNTALDALRHVPEIDFVVIGEGEITMAELVQALSNDADDFSTVTGLAHRSDGVPMLNAARKEETNLEKFRIDYDLIAKAGYAQLFPLKNLEHRSDLRAFPLMLGRGCSNKCIFCIHRLLAYRVRSMDSIFQDIDWAIEHLGTRTFMFSEPSFTERKKFVDKFCNRLIEENYDIKWYCETRVDMPLELLDLMHRAGCISLDFAMESASQRVLETLNKSIDFSHVEAFATRCNELGIATYVFAMCSLPDERTEDLEKTYSMLKKLYQFGFESEPGVLMIYPGTPLERLALERGVMPEGFSWYDESYRCEYSFVSERNANVPHYLEHLTQEQVNDFLRRVHALKQVRDDANRSIAEILRAGMRRLVSIRSARDIASLGFSIKRHLSSRLTWSK